MFYKVAFVEDQHGGTFGHSEFTKYFSNGGHLFFTGRVVGIDDVEQKVRDGELTPALAAQQILDAVDWPAKADG